MAKSLSSDWETQWRQIGHAQHQAAQQLKSWLRRFDAFQPTPPLRPVPPVGEHAPGSLPGTWESHRLGLAPLPGELVPQLSYRLYIPSGALSRRTGPMPVVVLLHGCRQTPEALAEGTRMNALAEREGFMVAYPQQPLRRSVHRCWQWFDLGAEEGGREAQAVAALIDELAERPDVRAGEIYLAGLSAGATMAALVALRYPEKVAAVGLHSGVVIGAADSPRAGLRAMEQGSATDPLVLLDAAGVTPGGPTMPAIVMHGLEDQAVHPVNGRLLARQFLAYNRMDDRLSVAMPPRVAAMAGAGAEAANEGVANEGVANARAANERPALRRGNYREARFGRWNKDLVKLVEVAGLDHAWSGGDGRVEYHSSTGPDASAMMWEFFREHRRK
ncbi:prolyl oligopeptidase family serine peptidase [Cupriavidus pauculus]|uniref:Prolyl oligopeptidase family serine peptidase n=1 Tax=Cupriavidus pauculus TaxID=82633 RepID=A0A5P2HB63_9BURK|nr:PHB depolymerase family esterase [Cupriavidus pauculus]QET04998.1 prolyl oligopeptidase family serine peptidase [Cupriavidus pauculus]